MFSQFEKLCVIFVRPAWRFCFVWKKTEEIVTDSREFTRMIIDLKFQKFSKQKQIIMYRLKRDGVYPH